MEKWKGLTNTGNLIGGSGSSNVAKYKGEIKEITIFNKLLSDAELAKVNYYLSKWALTTTVDSDGME